MIEVKGKECSAKILADSISAQGNRLTTFEIEVPRIVWAELLTHRMLSRNAASSRAIPFNKMQQQLTAKPVRFGKANKGMTDNGDHDQLINGLYTPEEWWNLAKLSASKFAEGYHEAGYAKQIFNRPTEAYQIMKGVISATEWANWYWLRDDVESDPTIAELARVMKEAQEQSVPELLQPGEYHLPYIFKQRDVGMNLHYFMEGADSENIEDYVELSKEDAIKVSCARCAAVSYRNEGYGMEKSVEIFGKLLGSDKKHASAFEHVATPMMNKYTVVNMDKFGEGDYVNDPDDSDTWQVGVSHVDRERNLWSGNFKGFVQFRKTVDGENYQGEI